MTQETRPGKAETANQPQPGARAGARRWSWSMAVMGVAFGGFFDGILLHQILQWHHLLSLVPGAGDLGAQVLWDGVFHLLMYLLAALALAGLWRSRGQAPDGRRSPALLLIGFGFWHGLDAVLSHWVLGIHRIRIDTAFPLAWDLGWLAVFGLGPMAAGLVLMRRPGGRGPRATGWVAGLALVAAGLAVWSLQPPPGAPLSVVVFAPWVAPERAGDALRRVEAKVLWSDAAGRVALVRLATRPGWRLYADGALMVGGAGMPDGCFAWAAS